MATRGAIKQTESRQFLSLGVASVSDEDNNRFSNPVVSSDSRWCAGTLVRWCASHYEFDCTDHFERVTYRLLLPGISEFPRVCLKAESLLFQIGVFRIVGNVGITTNNPRIYFGSSVVASLDPISPFWSLRDRWFSRYEWLDIVRFKSNVSSLLCTNFVRIGLICAWSNGFNGRFA